MSIKIYDSLWPIHNVVLNLRINIHTTVTASDVQVEAWIHDIYQIHRRRLQNLYVGIDVKSRPGKTHRSLHDNPIAVLQLCVGRRCLVFQILHAEIIPDALYQFLENRNFTFYGVGIEKTVEMLNFDYDMEVPNRVDLRVLAKNALGIDIITSNKYLGLWRLAWRELRLMIDKPYKPFIQYWDNIDLSAYQIKFACVDAFLSFEIGRRFSIYML